MASRVTQPEDFASDFAGALVHAAHGQPLWPTPGAACVAASVDARLCKETEATDRILGAALKFERCQQH